MNKDDPTLQYDANVLYPPIIIEKSEDNQSSLNDIIEINICKERKDFVKSPVKIFNKKEK